MWNPQNPIKKYSHREFLALSLPFFVIEPVINNLKRSLYLLADSVSEAACHNISVQQIGRCVIKSVVCILLVNLSDIAETGAKRQSNKRKLETTKTKKLNHEYVDGPSGYVLCLGKQQDDQSLKLFPGHSFVCSVNKYFLSSHFVQGILFGISVS